MGETERVTATSRQRQTFKRRIYNTFHDGRTRFHFFTGRICEFCRRIVIFKCQNPCPAPPPLPGNTSQTTTGPQINDKLWTIGLRRQEGLRVRSLVGLPQVVRHSVEQTIVDSLSLSRETGLILGSASIDHLRTTHRLALSSCPDGVASLIEIPPPPAVPPSEDNLN